MTTEVEERQMVVDEARTWLLTPYHSNADLKGAGVDCIRFIQRCFINAGLIGDFSIPHHSPQWALNQTSELLLEGLGLYAHEVEIPLPADVAIFKVGKCWGHSSLVVSWPKLIHANPPGSCRYDNVEINSILMRMTPRFFSIWPREPRS